MTGRKPRILLVPDIAWWVIGEMGKRIVQRFEHKYDFLFLPATVLGRRPDLLCEAVAAADAIHCLNDDGTVELFQGFDAASLPPLITWIHHVTTWGAHQQLAIERSQVITVCTQSWKREVASRTRGKLPIIVVPHGVDTEFFHPKCTERSRFGIPTKSFAVGFLGSKSSDLDDGRKATDVLIDVAEAAARRIPNFHIVIGGPGWEREEEALRSRGVSVSSTGFIRRDNLPDLYAAVDAYLLTSRVEGGPCTVFEAMSCGTAVVSTRVGAVPELIVDGVNGYSTEVDDRNALTAAIVELGLNPDHRAALAWEARETILSRTWDQALEPLEALYDSQIAESRARTPGAKLTSAWMKDPNALLRASCAADAILTVCTRVRKRSMNVGKGIRMLREMLSSHTAADVLKGAAMIRPQSSSQSFGRVSERSR
jgi:glycosyltransferase involved in cell wall biosynthesis